VTHRLVEVPAQRVGRRLIRRLSPLQPSPPAAPAPTHSGAARHPTTSTSA
jgi:hypothetical protein